MITNKRALIMKLREALLAKFDIKAISIYPKSIQDVPLLNVHVTCGVRNVKKFYQFGFNDFQDDKQLIDAVNIRLSNVLEYK